MLMKTINDTLVAEGCADEVLGEYDGQNNLDLNKWMHIAVVYDANSGSLTLYIDGEGMLAFSLVPFHLSLPSWFVSFL